MKLAKISLLGLLLCSPTIYAHQYPLSLQSKEFIGTCALIGALAGGFLGMLIAQDVRSHKQLPEDASTWERIKAYPWKCVLIPAAIGAGLTGLIASRFTTEKYLESAENELGSVEVNMLFKNAVCDDVSTQGLKKWSFESRWPTIATYEKLNFLYERICNAKSYAMSVIKSQISPLSSIASDIIKTIEEYESKIVDRIRSIRCDSAYLQEVIDRDRLHQLQEIAFQQKRIADAAWHAALHKPYKIYTQPLVVIRH